MPTTPGQRAIEFHNLAAHAHLKAAASHESGDHLTAHELSKLAQEHAAEAHQHSEALAQEHANKQSNNDQAHP
jgi:hypothetical protein